VTLLRDALRSEIWLLTRKPTTAQKTAIEEKKQRLLSQITKFHDSADHFISVVDLEDVPGPQDHDAFCLDENGDDLDEQEFWQSRAEEDDESDDEAEDIFPECLGLWMPSSLGIQAATIAGLEGLVKEERQLRIGQANDFLENLRSHLGQKSVLYQMHVRGSTSVQTDTRSRNDIQRLGLKINRDVRSYHQAQEALLNLGTSNDLLTKYQQVLPEHLSTEKEITEENRYGQGTHVLP